MPICITASALKRAADSIDLIEQVIAPVQLILDETDSSERVDRPNVAVDPVRAFGKGKLELLDRPLIFAGEIEHIR